MVVFVDCLACGLSCLWGLTRLVCQRVKTGGRESEGKGFNHGQGAFRW